MKAIILAAGQGTRLKKYTENLPKGMLNFNGKTLIEHQISLFRKCGTEKIIIVKGYAGDKIQYDGPKYYENTDYENTNMVESLLAAREEFDDDIIVSYSDVLVNENMLKKMMAEKGDYLVAVDTEWKKYWFARYGKVDFDTESLEMDGDNRIKSLGLSDPPIEEIDARYIGLLKFSKEGLKRILEIINRDYEEYSDKPWKQSGKTIKKAYMTDLLQALIEDHCEVRGVCFKNGWIEFDTNEDYETACKWVENGFIKELI